MAEKCNSCGAELFAGQQFCRFCGARTLPLAGGETPTQILPAERQVGAADTAPQRPSSAGTDPVLQPPPTSYYAPPQAQQPYPPAHPQAQQTSALSPRRGGSARRWLVALVIIALAGTATLGALLYAIVSRRDAVREMRIIRQPGAAGKIIEHPPMPPAPPATLGGASLLDEDGAQVSGDRTTLTKSFPLKEGALLSLKNLRGDIEIEG